MGKRKKNIRDLTIKSHNKIPTTKLAPVLFQWMSEIAYLCYSYVQLKRLDSVIPHTNQEIKSWTRKRLTRDAQKCAVPLPEHHYVFIKLKGIGDLITQRKVIVSGCKKLVAITYTFIIERKEKKDSCRCR